MRPVVRALSSCLLASIAFGCAQSTASRAPATEPAAEPAAASFDPVTEDPAEGHPTHPAALSGLRLGSGGARMNGIVYLAAGPGPHPTVVLLHGYPGEERNLDLAQAMRRAGWNVLFFHYRGAWGSGGAFSFGHAIEDVRAAVSVATAEPFRESFRGDPERVALVGHSMGGWLALLVGSELPKVRCVASIAGANLGLLGAAAATDEEAAQRYAQALGRWSGPIRGTNGPKLVAELAARPASFDPRLRSAALAGRPLLLVAGTRDLVTPPADHHAPLVAALRNEGAARLESVELDADHAFSGRRIALARAVVGFLNRRCR